MLELAEIFRRYGPAYRTTCADRMPPRHLAAMQAIARCRTEALGGHVSQCPACGDLEDSDHSCKNRHCPTCQNEAATHWLEQQRMLLLPVPYFLVTFTLPEERRPLARSHQILMDNLLFQTSAAALHTLALDPHDLGGQIGMVGVLHTWTRDLASHPHSHDLVPGGALSPEGSQWFSPRCEAWLVPVRALSRLFRGKCKAALTTAGRCQPVPPQVWHKAWVTHCQPAGTGTAVLAYFAPDMYRIALTTNRLEKLEDGHVTFRFKKRSGAGWKRLTLPAETFIHRFLQHVLPRRFSKVRSYGLLSPSRRKGLPQIRTLLAACPSNDRVTQSTPPQDRPRPRPVPKQERRCRTCGGLLVVLWRLSPHPREPPEGQQGTDRPRLASRGTSCLTRRARRGAPPEGTPLACARALCRGLVTLSHPHGPMPCCKTATPPRCDPLLPPVRCVHPSSLLRRRLSHRLKIQSA